MAVALRSCKNMRERNVYVRVATDTLLRPHLRSRGFVIDNECRLCSRETESFRHFLDAHPTRFMAPGEQLNPALKRKIDRICREELEQLSHVTKRVKLNLDAESISFLAPMFFLPDFDRNIRLTFSKKCYPSKRTGAAKTKPRKNYKKRKRNNPHSNLSHC